MSGLCNTVSGAAVAFTILAFVAAAVETYIALKAKRAALREAQRSRQELTVDSLLEALAKVLAALKDLPAWVAIFLAAMALIWTATSAPGLCT